MYKKNAITVRKSGDVRFETEKGYLHFYDQKENIGNKELKDICNSSITNFSSLSKDTSEECDDSLMADSDTKEFKLLSLQKLKKKANALSALLAYTLNSKQSNEPTLKQKENKENIVHSNIEETVSDVHKHFDCNTNLGIQDSINFTDNSPGGNDRKLTSGIEASSWEGRFNVMNHFNESSTLISGPKQLYPLSNDDTCNVNIACNASSLFPSTSEMTENINVDDVEHIISINPIGVDACYDECPLNMEPIRQYPSSTGGQNDVKSSTPPPPDVSTIADYCEIDSTTNINSSSNAEGLAMEPLTIDTSFNDLSNTIPTDSSLLSMDSISNFDILSPYIDDLLVHLSKEDQFHTSQSFVQCRGTEEETIIYKNPPPYNHNVEAGQMNMNPLLFQTKQGNILVFTPVLGGDGELLYQVTDLNVLIRNQLGNVNVKALDKKELCNILKIPYSGSQCDNTGKKVSEEQQMSMHEEVGALSYAVYQYQKDDKINVKIPIQGNPQLKKKRGKKKKNTEATNSVASNITDLNTLITVDQDQKRGCKKNKKYLHDIISKEQEEKNKYNVNCESVNESKAKKRKYISCKDENLCCVGNAATESHLMGERLCKEKNDIVALKKMKTETVFEMTNTLQNSYMTSELSRNTGGIGNSLDDDSARNTISQNVHTSTISANECVDLDSEQVISRNEENDGLESFLVDFVTNETAFNDQNQSHTEFQNLNNENSLVVMDAMVEENHNAYVLSNYVDFYAPSSKQTTLMSNLPTMSTPTQAFDESVPIAVSENSSIKLKTPKSKKQQYTKRKKKLQYSGNSHVFTTDHCDYNESASKEPEVKIFLESENRHAQVYILPKCQNGSKVNEFQKPEAQVVIQNNHYPYVIQPTMYSPVAPQLVGGFPKIVYEPITNINAGLVFQQINNKQMDIAFQTFEGINEPFLLQKIIEANGNVKSKVFCQDSQAIMQYHMDRCPALDDMTKAEQLANVQHDHNYYYYNKYRNNTKKSLEKVDKEIQVADANEIDGNGDEIQNDIEELDKEDFYDESDEEEEVPKKKRKLDSDSHFQPSDEDQASESDDNSPSECEEDSDSDWKPPRKKKYRAKPKPKVKHPCPTCGEVYSSYYISYHIYTKHEEPVNTFICDKCGKGFPSAQFLCMHRKAHENNTKRCSKCLKHIKVDKFEEHVSECKAEYKREECEICGAKVRDLKLHINTIHGTKRKLECSYEGCFETFTTKYALKVHIRRHTGEKPISCEICDYSCKQRASLLWHMKTKHDKNMRQKRDDYNKQFSC